MPRFPRLPQPPGGWSINRKKVIYDLEKKSRAPKRLTEEERKIRARQYQRAWRRANREKAAAIRKRFYDKNREKILAEAKEYKLAHPEKSYYKKHRERILKQQKRDPAFRAKRREYMREWEANHREHVRERQRKLYATNPAPAKLRDLKRRLALEEKEIQKDIRQFEYKHTGFEEFKVSGETPRDIRPTAKKKKKNRIMRLH